MTITETVGSTVVGQLPTCPEWCARDHARLGEEPEITHTGLRVEVAEVSTWEEKTTDVQVELAAFEGVEGLQVVRGPVRVRVDDGDGGYYLTPQQARLLGAALTTAGNTAEQLAGPTSVTVTSSMADWAERDTDEEAGR